MEELKCKNCGAPLTQRYDGVDITCKCEYCGSVYSLNYVTRNLAIVNSGPAQTLQSVVRVPDWQKDRIDYDDLSKYTIKQLTAQLADGLAAYMRLDTEKDPFTMSTIIRGTVRVIPPDFRF